VVVTKKICFYARLHFWRGDNLEGIGSIYSEKPKLFCDDTCMFMNNAEALVVVVVVVVIQNTLS